MRRLSIGASGTTVRFLVAALLAGALLGALTATDCALAADRAAVTDTDDDPAAEADQPRRAVLQGTLLVADQERGPWRLLSRGDELSAAGVLRVAETAPVALAWDGAKLTADAGARLAASGAGVLVVVEGRVYFDGAPTATPCALRAGDVAIEIPAGAAVELSLGDDNVVRAIATRAPSAGQPPIKATAPGLTEPAEIAPGFAFSNGLQKNSRTYLPLDDPKKETERIAAWTATEPAIGLGQLVVSDPETQRAERLNIARSHVNVVLAPPVALVQLDQSFYNPQPRTREGTFLFNLPRGASVSRFAMYVDASTLVEGELIDRRRAADVYDRIVRGQRDPAILEQLGDNLFRMRVFPILGQDVKRVLLDFTLPLAAADGRCRFELPLLTDLEPIWDFRCARQSLVVLVS
ncbi:MAG: hypothetical protein K2Y37_05040 [Pirellulales bacterium]|nr:hypothetical protein [Pirellulales bacterium]